MTAYREEAGQGDYKPNQHMPFSLTRLMACLAAQAATLSLALAPAPAGAYEQGELLAGLYTAPGEFFTVKSPLGPSPILIDGVVCTPNLHMPRGSAMFRNNPEVGPVREDSWRGVVALIRGGQTYVLKSEVADALEGAEVAFDHSSPGWNDFLPHLAEFYRGMTFQDVPGLDDQPQLADQNAGT